MEKTEKIIKKVESTLREWAFKDILRASDGGAKMGAFILASCYIDYLAWYYSNKSKVGERYKEFVKKFLKNYNADDLYYSLRCKLVHYYSEGGKYEFTHNKPKFHLKPSKLPNRIIINLENFLKELKNATEQYFELVDSNQTYKNRLIKKYEKVGILGVSPVNSISNLTKIVKTKRNLRVSQAEIESLTKNNKKLENEK